MKWCECALACSYPIQKRVRRLGTREVAHINTLSPKPLSLAKTTKPQPPPYSSILQLFLQIGIGIHLTGKFIICSTIYFAKSFYMCRNSPTHLLRNVKFWWWILVSTGRGKYIVGGKSIHEAKTPTEHECTFNLINSNIREAHFVLRRAALEFTHSTSVIG